LARIIPQCDLGPELEAVRAELDDAHRTVLASGQFIMGPQVALFEHEAAGFLGMGAHAVGVASGTDALVIALRALGIGAGHEVITTPLSFFATAEAISRVGATPVFCDIDPSSLTIDPDKLEECLSPKTKAVLPVHLFGHPCSMDRILHFASKHGLLVVEDVAQAFGASDGGRRLGTLGEVGCFSFFPTKNLGCLGDGGMILTHDERIASHARRLRSHGASGKYVHEEIGYNSRLDELQAAFLRVKLPHVHRWNDMRREAAARYRAMLEDVQEVGLPTERRNARHVYHQFTVRVMQPRRDALRSHLSKRAIETAIHYPSTIQQSPVYALAYRRMHCPEAERAVAEVLSLPFWPMIGEPDQRRVANAIRNFFGRPTD
jgi:dTDP-4-amino-4,6-dideoxygalactose transaminase